MRFVANTPLAVSLLSQKTRLTAIKTQLLNATATQQLAIYHHSYNTNFLLSAGGPHPDHSSLQYEMNNNLNAPNKGYPVKCKKIAIANGSGNATPSGIQNGEVLLLHQRVVDLGIFSTTTFLKYNALPSHTIQNIFQGFVQLKIFGIPIGLNLAAYAVDATEPLDGMPAGTQVFHSITFNNLITHPIHHFLHPCITSPNSFPSGITLINNRLPDAFIPTVSALDLTGITQWDYNFHVGHSSKLNNYGGYVFLGDVETPFDEVYVNFENDEHVSLVANSAPWALNELGPHNLKLQNHIVTYDTDYEAVTSIESGFDVTDELNTGDFELTNRTHSNFTAGTEVTFKPGFSTNIGTMHAYINDISCTVQKNMDFNSDNDPLIYELEEKKKIINPMVQMIVDNEEDIINLYPNPASHSISIENIKGLINKIEISNLQGNWIKIINETTSKITIQTETWSKGVYVCSISLDNGDVLIRKFIVD